MGTPTNRYLAGQYLGHSMQFGFYYRYTCPCGKVFTSRAPELSEPTLCHKCYSGLRKGERVRAWRRPRKRKTANE